MSVSGKLKHKGVLALSIGQPLGYFGVSDWRSLWGGTFELRLEWCERASLRWVHRVHPLGREGTQQLQVLPQQTLVEELPSGTRCWLSSIFCYFFPPHPSMGILRRQIAQKMGNRKWMKKRKRAKYHIVLSREQSSVLFRVTLIGYMKEGLALSNQ